MFSYTLKKSGEGVVTLQEIDVIPTWVNKYSSGNGYKYTIYPIESIDNATSKYPKLASKLKESYNRTEAILKDGLTECQQHIGCDVTFD
jgi:hypothetical protein